MELNSVHCCICRGAAPGRVMVVHEGRAFCFPCFCNEYPQVADRMLKWLCDKKMALKLEEIVAGKAKQQQLAGLKQYQNTVLENSTERTPTNTRLELAKVARVSDNTIAKVKKIEAEGTEGR